MILFEHTTFDAASISANLGMPEYSYWFVRKAFGHVLARFGEVRAVLDPELELDAAVARAKTRGEESVFFSFNPPHYVPLRLPCPTVPVFAWEYDTIPDESWTANPQYDWRVTLASTGCAVTHCTAAVDAVRRAMGHDFPVWSIPAPVFDAQAGRAATARGMQPPTDLVLDGGIVIDAGTIDLSLFTFDRVDQHGARALRLLRRAFADTSWRPQTVRIEGVVYTAVFNTADGRKNWHDVLAGFVWAFRDEPRATLILKITHADMFEGIVPVLRHISKLGRFRCRVLLIHGLLGDGAYARMVEATSYAVNAAHGEGQCLPLMEFMSAGRPAVAPGHSAMADYLSPDNGFVVASDQCITNWPHDHREARRCMSNWVRFPDMVRAYRESFRVASREPARYAAMSAAAVASLRAFCSDEVVAARVGEVLAHVRRPAPDAPAPHDLAREDRRRHGGLDEATGILAPGFPIGKEDHVVFVGCDDRDGIAFAGRAARVALVDAGVRADGAIPLALPLPFPDNSASRIVCDRALVEVEDPQALLAELVRIGRPGALYLLAVPGAAHSAVQQQVAPAAARAGIRRVLADGELAAQAERAGLVVEQRYGDGFFWALWSAMVWQSGSDGDRALADFTRVWSDVTAGAQGATLSMAFDEAMPARTLVVARKPAGRATRFLDMLLGRSAR